MKDRIREPRWWQPDKKYSIWRHEYLVQVHNRRDLYCMDLDWIEWRKGGKAALVETTRSYGKPIQVVKDAYLKRNNGFQCQVVYETAREAGVPAYLVIIDDKDPNNYYDGYHKATFHIFQLISIRCVEYRCTLKGGEEYYQKFISALERQRPRRVKQ